MRRRPRIVPPPYPGPVVHGGVLVGVSDEDLAGIPLPPPVELIAPAEPAAEPPPPSPPGD
jgi:hypothetical protein